MVGPRPRIPRFSGSKDAGRQARGSSPHEPGERPAASPGGERGGSPLRGPGPAGSGSSTVTAPVPAHTFNGRLLALVVVATIIVFLAAPTAKIYMDQRAQIAELEQDIARQQRDQQQLKKEEQRWSDDTYVEQQARERMFYVMPGESAYLVAGADGNADEPLDSSAQQVEAGKPAWADGLWRSVLDSAFPDAPARVVPDRDGAGAASPGVP